MGRPVWDRLLLKGPIFGKMVRMLAIARFTRTLSPRCSRAAFRC